MQTKLDIAFVLIVVSTVLAVLISCASNGPPSLTEGGEEPTTADLIAELAELVREHYILEERIPAIEEALRERQRAGAYDGLEGEDLAWRLTQDLRSASSDLHFGVVPAEWQGGGPPAAVGGPMPDDGIAKIEVLEGNVGYLEIVAFVDPTRGASAADLAFTTLGTTDALLIDVRRSRGGHPGMVAHLASHLFGGNAFLLNRIEWRNREPNEFWTRADLPVPRYTDREVYVLTSSATPSAAEGFSYHLQQFGRATVVGETTAGAAHPVSGFPLGESFRALVPTGRAVNPLTGTNWEGEGVVPDVAVAAEDALETAHRLALENISRDGP